MGNDTWMRKLSRGLLGPMVGALPDAKSIALLSAGFGLVAAVCFAMGDPLIRHLGTGLFLIAMLIERAGPLRTQSEASDPTVLRASAMVQVLTFVGIGFGLRYSPLGAEAIGMGIVSGFAVSALILLARRVEQTEDGRQSALNGIETTDLLVIVPIVIWLGKTETMLAIAAYAAPAMTLGLFLAFLIRQRKKR